MTPFAPGDLQRARAAHDKRIAAARARIEKINAKVARNHARGKEKALQRAAARFLPPGVQLDAPRRLDLERWPYAGETKVLYDVSNELREAILAEDAVCVWCREAPSTTIDHVRALNRGGTNHPLNLVGACSTCNSLKADFLPKEIGWVLRLPRRAFDLADASRVAP